MGVLPEREAPAVSLLLQSSAEGEENLVLFTFLYAPVLRLTFCPMVSPPLFLFSGLASFRHRWFGWSSPFEIEESHIATDLIIVTQI